MSSAQQVVSGSLPQDQVNRAVYESRRVYRYYLSTQLTPAETACLLKYQPCFAARDVLDIGVGAGRTTRYLAPLARRYEAVDYSPVMVNYLQQVMPDIRVHHADFRNLAIFEDRSFDFVFAPDNVIDALGPEDRLRALSEASRVLRPEGILAFSTHNLRYKRAFSGPRIEWAAAPWRLGINAVKYMLGWWNHRRVGRLRTVTADYALLNDPGHFYACLHYYIARPAARLQLADARLRLLEVFDRNGSVLGQGDDDGDNPSLLYVARRDPA